MIWTEDQVANLKERQDCGYLHPYTCENGHGNLIPTTEGWICHECTYTQIWAFAEDLDGRFREFDWRRNN